MESRAQAKILRLIGGGTRKATETMEPEQQATCERIEEVDAWLRVHTTQRNSELGLLCRGDTALLQQETAQLLSDESRWRQWSSRALRHHLGAVEQWKGTTEQTIHLSMSRYHHVIHEDLRRVLLEVLKCRLEALGYQVERKLGVLAVERAQMPPLATKFGDEFYIDYDSLRVKQRQALFDEMKPGANHLHSQSDVLLLSIATELSRRGKPFQSFQLKRHAKNCVLCTVTLPQYM